MSYRSKIEKRGKLICANLYQSVNMVQCTISKKGFITETEVFELKEKINTYETKVQLVFCSNVMCDYNERVYS